MWLQRYTKFFASDYNFFRMLSISAGLSDSKKTHYQVLGLALNASQEDIRQSFVKLSKETHPDMNPNDPDNHVKFVRLNEAYSVLSKTPSRRQYDISLAYQLRARDLSTSHTAGSSASPGSSSGGSESGQSASEFWDESIWEMRDRTRDATAFYGEDSYYGVKGLRRQSNAFIAIMSLVFMVVGGSLYFYAALHYSKRKQKAMELMSARNSRALKEVEELARVNGSRKQIEILEQRVAAKEAMQQVNK